MHSPLLASAGVAAFLTCSHAAGIDFGPTYGMDYSGGDYNVTDWHSPSNMSANHWYAAMLECEAYCFSDPNCCTWTYVTPEGGASDPERCCLKNSVPAEIGSSTHWTGAASRATSPTCQNPPGPPFPGPSWQQPAIHNSPDCLHADGWHDIAGALTFKNVHHVFQGCPAAGGWHHATSTDLVHWTNGGIDMVTLNEPYGASSPCSGFVTVGQDGVPCAGFRQCSGNWPGRSNQQVPLELRCAQDDNLTQWGEPEYIYWFYFNRALPYDPVRPWQGTDGLWYSTIAADGCNGTAVPCDAGGREYLFSSPALRGPQANWTLLPTPLWTSNVTVLTPFTGATLDREFVTVDYIGNVTGDPAGGATRVLTNNVCGNGCCGCTTAFYLGSQASEGAPFVVDYAAANATGMIDWGAFVPANNGGVGIAGLTAASGPYMMARTLSTSPNQVAEAGRRTMIAWLSGTDGRTLQSLGRDLSLAVDGSGLLQQFVPELQVLRSTTLPSEHMVVGGPSPSVQPPNSGRLCVESVRSQQVEILAVFTYDPVAAANANFGVTVLGNPDGQASAPIGVSLEDELVYLVGSAGPFLPDPSKLNTVWLHAYVDHVLVTAIVNNRTALTQWYIPDAETSNLIELFGVDGISVNATLHVWPLDGI